MAYDSARGRVVLFGGYPRTGSAPRDTWEWDGVRWLQRTPATVPTEDLLRLAYDAARQRVVGVGHDAVWEWDGQTWRGIRRPLSVHELEVIAYDPRLRRVVGVTTGLSYRIAAWDGTDWQAISSGTNLADGDGGGVLHYHEAAGALIYIHGSGSSTYAIGPMPGAVPYGSPCASVAPVPRVTATAAGVGRPCRFEIVAARPWSLAAIGLSATRQATPVGPCTLLLGQPIWFIPVATNGAGFASVAVPLPRIPDLRETQLHAQGLAVAPDGSAFGLSFTSGLQLTLGD